MRLARKSLLAGLASGLLALPATAQAEAIQAHSGDLSAQLAALATGDQLVIENYNGDVRFGGYTVELEDFSGVAGYGSEVAYLITVVGEAELGDGDNEVEAEAGRMLLIPPFGQQPGSQRFDARRLHDALSEEGKVSALPTVAQLGDLATAQERGIFLGRLGRTSFNVATMGSAQAEMGRRERVGGVHVRNARFTGEAGAGTLEQQIVTRFLDALAAGEVAAVAEMLDPLPYGGGTMGASGEQARMAMAGNLITRHNWSRLAGAQPEEIEAAVWRAGEVTIALRRTTEFAFVESIEVGS